VLVLLVAGGAIAARLLLKDHVRGLGGGGSPSKPVPMHAVGVYDPPPGDGVERDDLVPFATDGNQDTAWQTEHYATPAFGNLKDGVGLVLAAPKSVKLASVTVTSHSPGVSAEIKAGGSASGPFRTVSSVQTMGAKTTFDLQMPSPERYYVLWITHLPSSGQAHVNEVTATR
jgi:hypothetical protein